MYFGGNSELRGYDYLQFVGQNVVFANAELRFPLIEAALTPIGVIGGIRGVFFANIGGALVQQPAERRLAAAGEHGYKFCDERRRNLPADSSASDRRGRIPASRRDRQSNRDLRSADSSSPASG